LSNYRLAKPFGIEEPLARIFTTLRRSRPTSEVPLGAALTGIAAVRSYTRPR
jgi:hypothetical protein